MVLTSDAAIPSSVGADGKTAPSWQSRYCHQSWPCSARVDSTNPRTTIASVRIVLTGVRRLRVPHDRRQQPHRLRRIHPPTLSHRPSPGSVPLQSNTYPFAIHDDGIWVHGSSPNVWEHLSSSIPALSSPSTPSGRATAVPYTAVKNSLDFTGLNELRGREFAR
jgi:hypothetical protein